MPERLTIIPVIPTEPDVENPAIEAYGMNWANNADMTGAQDLATTTVTTGLIWIRGTTITAGRDISHVSMYLDGTFIRDDPEADYDMRPANGVEVSEGAHVARMVYHYLDGSTPTDVSITFTVDIPAGPDPGEWPGGDLPVLAAPLHATHTAMSLGINRVGYWADAPGLHVPVSLKAPRGSFATSSHGQVIEREDVNGGITINHDDVTIQNCRVDYITNRAARSNCTVRWNVIGRETGLEGRQGVLIGGNFYAYRNWMVGGVDILKWDDGIGNWEIRENILGPFYMMLNDPHQNSDTDWRSHNDIIQDQYGGTKFWLIDNRIEVFAFQGYEWTSGNQPSGTNGDVHSGTSNQTRITPNPLARDAMGLFPAEGYGPGGRSNIATSGLLIQDSGGRSTPSKRPVRDLRIDGNYWDGDTYAYIQLNNGLSGGPTGYIANNIFRRRYNNGGSRANVEGSSKGSMRWGVGPYINRWDTPTGAAVPRPSGFTDYNG